MQYSLKVMQRPFYVKGHLSTDSELHKTQLELHTQYVILQINATEAILSMVYGFMKQWAQIHFYFIVTNQQPLLLFSAKTLFWSSLPWPSTNIFNCRLHCSFYYGRKKLLEMPVYKRKRENKIKILWITTYAHSTERKWKLWNQREGTSKLPGILFLRISAESSLNFTNHRECSLL